MDQLKGINQHRTDNQMVIAREKVKMEWRVIQEDLPKEF